MDTDNKKIEIEHVDSVEKMTQANTMTLTDRFGSALEKDDSQKFLVRKLDWRIMPTLWVMYFMNYVSVANPWILRLVFSIRITLRCISGHR